MVNKHMFSHPSAGTEESVEAITMDDLKEFYNKNFSPSVSNFHIVGNINEEKALGALNRSGN